jgi:hypothetical protein
MFFFQCPVIFVFVSFLLCSGCSVLKHKDQLLTLRAYSRNKEEKDAWVADQDRRFELLLEKVRAGEVVTGTPQTWFLDLFGEPVLRRDAAKDGQREERWLYRYATRFFESPKVYLSFDAKGRLWVMEYIPSPEATRNQGGEDGTFIQKTATEKDGHPAGQAGR